MRFDTLLKAASDRKLPPVDQWHPQRIGDIDIRIKADGRWFHEGTEIKRQRLVDLFATVLRRDPMAIASSPRRKSCAYGSMTRPSWRSTWSPPAKAGNAGSF